MCFSKSPLNWTRHLPLWHPHGPWLSRKSSSTWIRLIGWKWNEKLCNLRWWESRGSTKLCLLQNVLTEWWPWVLAGYVNHRQVRTNWADPADRREAASSHYDPACTSLTAWTCEVSSFFFFFQFTHPGKTLGGLHWIPEIGSRMHMCSCSVLCKNEYSFNEFLKKVPEQNSLKN